MMVDTEMLAKIILILIVVVVIIALALLFLSPNTKAQEGADLTKAVCRMLGSC
jgi:preprotein translocase subunit SecG